MVLSKLFVLLIALTACHTTSPPTKSMTSSTQTTYVFEQQSRHNIPVLEMNSESIKLDKNKIIFKGKVELRRDQSVNFLADYISIELDENGKRMNGVVEMKGNISMTTQANFNIKSEEAISSDFGTYIDFFSGVSISDKGHRYNTDWVRYYFLKGSLQFKWWDDIPIRGQIEHRLHRIADNSGFR